MFELTRDGKSKKMATLIDEFGYFDQNDMLVHCNYHKRTECCTYNPTEVDKEFQVTDVDSEFYLTGHNNITLHTIPEI
ncbi:hypothetical protein GOM44_07675 [Wolbachia endosymbiont of Atemnus politus]|uniref:hypothetical protein n=1 Tax=Wolbachia endosymbiont of Atemnus politus TaxID=2682840 RepID=UPI001572FE58|nr:hypothetical protein [Wolbachia endosymbiont of Atemnus politus]NSX83956.1 hypothetical protein [Wolbachia endosymbiont of Atemnus politus]